MLLPSCFYSKETKLVKSIRKAFNMIHQTIGKEEKPYYHIIYYEIYVIQFKLNSKKLGIEEYFLNIPKKKKPVTKNTQI